MNTTTKDSAGWGYANSGNTTKAHFFATEQSASACGKYRAETVIIFGSQSRTNLMPSVYCAVCSRKVSGA